MIKVELDPVFDDYDTFKKSSHYAEMKVWCRDNFGKNPLRGPKIWFTNYRCDYNDVTYNDPNFFNYTGWIYYPSFYFTDPKHAHWFRLRWS